MKTRWVGYKIWRLISLSRRPEALAVHPSLSALDSNSAFTAALEQYSVEQIDQAPNLNWPDAPISASNLGRWITQTFLNVDDETRPSNDEVSRDTARYAAPLDKLVDPPNRVSGKAADCLASFVEERYKIGRDVFLTPDLHTFIYGIDQLYPPLSFEPLKRLAEEASPLGLLIDQPSDHVERSRIRLTVVGEAPEPEGDILIAEHGFHCFADWQNLGPAKIHTGWHYAFFNLRSDGGLDQIIPNTELLPHMDPAAGLVDFVSPPRITPKTGLQGQDGEAGTLFIAAFRERYEAWEELACAPLTISPVSSDHVVERAALARFGLWLTVEYKAGRAAIAARPFSCVSGSS